MDDFTWLDDLDAIFQAGGDPPAGGIDRKTVEVAAPAVSTDGKETVSDGAPHYRGSSIKNLTDDEKPREKALRQGMDSLTDVELLAILLGSGIPGKSVLDLSREILKDNDNRLAFLSRKSIPELVKKYKGMGTAKATLLVAAMAFGARTQSDLQVKDPQMSSSEVVYNYMRSRLERLNNEEFWVLHLSRANRLQSAEQVSKGGQSQTSVDVKLIAKSVIDRLSAAVILCHNHPSGNLVPSREDDNLTRRISEVCKLVDVPVLDHIIVGPTGYYSYRDQGRI